MSIFEEPLGRSVNDRCRDIAVFRRIPNELFMITYVRSLLLICIVCSSGCSSSLHFSKICFRKRLWTSRTCLLKLVGWLTNCIYVKLLCNYIHFQEKLIMFSQGNDGVAKRDKWLRSAF